MRITRPKGSPAAPIGYVEAPDQDRAIREFEIINLEAPKQLTTQRAE